MLERLDFSRIRLAWAAVIALTVSAVTYGHGFSTFNPVRLRLATGPAIVLQDGSYSYRGPLTDARDGKSLTAPFAVVIAASSESEQLLRLRIDNQPVCEVNLTPGTRERFDCAMRGALSSTDDHTVQLLGDRPWSLEYLELATHHGGNAGLFEFYILPSGSKATASSVLVAGILAFVTCLVWLLRPRLLPRRLRLIHSGATALITLLALLTLLSPYLTPFALTYRYPVIGLCLAIAMAPRIGSLPWAYIFGSPTSSTSRTASVASIALVAFLVGAAFWRLAAAQIEGFGGNYTGLVSISQSFFDQNPVFEERPEVRRTVEFNDGGGYDGQFMYYMTFDPLLRQFAADPDRYGQVVDAPAYRFGRIGFSWLGYAFAMGQWQKFASSLVWLVVVGTALTAVGVATMAAHSGSPPAVGLLVLLIPGFWFSVQRALPEPVAASFLVAGIWAMAGNRLRLAAVALGASLLIRETGAVVVLCLAATLWRSKGAHAALTWTAMVAAPVICWRLYVGLVLFPSLGLVAFFQDPGDLDAPFRGLWQMASLSWSGAYFGGTEDLSRAGRWFPVVLIFGLATAGRLLWSRREPLAFAAFVYGWVAVSLNFEMIWTHVGNGQRATYEMFLLMALLTAMAPYHRNQIDRTMLWGFWLTSGVYVTFGYFNAELVRAALLW